MLKTLLVLFLVLSSVCSQRVKVFDASKPNSTLALCDDGKNIFETDEVYFSPWPVQRNKDVSVEFVGRLLEEIRDSTNKASVRLVG